ncbi:MAG TPA: TetR/AcrR family transcriptional regulator [Rhizomicrobium sp.]|jgi:AcrR family transcriptional regulator
MAAPDVVPPRERILAAACELFYARGIRAVSVDDIATAAQTNKMTFYRHFESKDLLVAEYLRSLAREADGLWDELERAHPGDPMAQLRAWVGHIGTMISDCKNRGCALANAAVEIPEKDHPARAVIEAYKKHKHERIAALCRNAGFCEPERIADEIFLLFEGARVDQQSVGAGGAGMRVGELICTLLKSSPRNTTN